MRPVAIGETGIYITREIFEGLTSRKKVEDELKRLRNDESAFIIRESKEQIVLDYNQYLDYLQSLLTQTGDSYNHMVYKEYDELLPIQDDFDIFIDDLYDEAINREDIYAMLMLRGLYGDDVARKEFPELHKILMLKIGD